MSIHTHADATGKPSELAVCPVMNITVNKEEAKTYGLTRTYKGQVYYFCCNTCTDMFDKNPEEYAKSPA